MEGRKKIGGVGVGVGGNLRTDSMRAQLRAQASSVLNPVVKIVGMCGSKKFFASNSQTA